MKILICGDSYMALDPGKKNSHMNSIHWSRHLGDNLEILNLSKPGASNTMILMQLQKAVIEKKFDGIIIGFTNPGRLELLDGSTTCHYWITDEQKQLDQLYRKNIDWYTECIRNIAIVEYTVLLARTFAKTVYSLNGIQDFVTLYSSVKLIDLKEKQMPFSLVGHREFGNLPENGDNRPWASFHVADPEVHLQYAEQVKNMLFQN